MAHTVHLADCRDQILQAKGAFIEKPTPEDVQRMYTLAVGDLGIPDTTPKVRQRKRKAELKWTTLEKLLRHAKARRGIVRTVRAAEEDVEMTEDTQG